MIKTTVKRAQPYVNGKWISSERETVSIKSPYSGEVIGEQILATQDDVERALASAYKAKKHIANIPSYERAKILKRAAMLLEQEKKDSLSLFLLS